MNYKKSIAFILALTMCIPVVASSTSVVPKNVGVYATETDNTSYDYVYSYDEEVDYVNEDGNIRISNLKEIDSVKLTISGLDSSEIFSFNCNRYDGTDWNYSGAWFGNVTADENGVLSIIIDTKDYIEVWANTVDVVNENSTITVYKATPIAIKETSPTTTDVDITDFEFSSISYDEGNAFEPKTSIDIGNSDSITINLTNNTGSDTGCNIALYYKDGDEYKKLTNASGFYNSNLENIITFERSSFKNTDVTEVYIVNNAPNTVDTDGIWFGDLTLESIKLSSYKEYDIPQVSELDLTKNQTDETFHVDAIQSVTSSDETIVSIDDTNIITALAKGTTTLIVTYINGDTVEIPVTVKTLELSEETKSIPLDGGKVTLTTIESSSKPIKWESSDETVATIDEVTGAITPVSEGSTIITATDEFGNDDTCEVTITSNEVVEVEKSSVDLETTDTYQIVITNSVNPKGYSSSNEKVATVDKTGLITAIGEGTATITVTSKDDVPTTINVNVTNPTPIEVSSSKTTMVIGESLEITVDNGVAKTWKSSDEKVATVDKNGKVTAISDGKVTITATDKVGNTSKVDIEVKKFSLNRDSLNLAIKDTYTLKSDVSTIESFTVDDDTIATVTDKGQVTAISVGSTTITVEDIFGNKIDVPVSVFDSTNYNDGEVSVGEDADGNEVVTINKGDATEVKLVLSSKANGVASGVLSYWDAETETVVEVPWVAEFNNKGISNVYLGNLSSDVEELTFRLDYAGYWDSEQNQWIDTSTTVIPVEVVSVSGNLSKKAPEIDGHDLLTLKKHILGIERIQDTSSMDYNQDGMTNVLDYIYAKRVILGLI